MTMLTGAVVGPLGVPAGAASVLHDGTGVDFAIGGLGFRVYATDDHPYERATAQFRKEQFDNSGEYGDQSLLGYWTKGQMSFHQGSGLEYITEGQDFRYWESEGVNPFEPGEVVCAHSWDAHTGTFAANSWAGGGNGFWAVLDGTTLKYATTAAGATSSYNAATGSISCATAGVVTAFVGVSDAGAGRVERVGIGAGAPATEAIYTHTLPITNVFYAKDRLWVVDSDNALYQLAPKPSGALPVAMTSTDLVFTAGDAWSGDWLLADTPGPVLVANGNRIFSISIGSDGTVPTMSSPVQAAELPLSEDVRGMAHYLGHVCLVTSKGVRVCVLSDQGQLVLGPLLVEQEVTDLTTIAAEGSSFYPALDGDVYQIDLAQPVGEGLEFAWAKHEALYASGACGTFAIGGTDSTLMAWSPTAVHSLGAGYQAGSLTTALHRFGTLENKKFLTVRVRVGGTAGTVQVSKVVASGAVVPLYTLDVSDTQGEDITLSESTPSELLGLKFTLTPSGSETPILRGYQLRALPAPKRQRMIRVPLMMFDQERRGTVRAMGRSGSAWTRLRELEDMEETGGTFIFQDFRTGESGQCYIESIEHRGNTPPSRQSDGFGGIVFLTLRKL